MTPRLAAVAAFGLACCLGRSAAAQPAPPNPFEDYERFATSEPSAAPEVPTTAGTRLRTAPWTWSLGLRSQLGFSRLTYQREPDEPDGAATSLLFRLAPSLNVFIFDRLQIGLSPGLLVRAGGNNFGDDASDANMLIEATAHYFAAISPRFSFVPGLGLGGYFGGGNRQVEVTTPEGETTRVSRGSKPAGMSLAVSMGIAYQIDDHFQLRSGLSANAFFGWDEIEGRASPVQNSAIHVGIPVEIFYVF